MSFIFLCLFVCVSFSVYRVYVPDGDVCSRTTCSGGKWRYYCSYHGGSIEPSNHDGSNWYTPDSIFVLSDRVYDGVWYQSSQTGFCHGFDESNSGKIYDKYFVRKSYLREIDVCPDIMRYPLVDFRFNPTTYWKMNVKHFTELMEIRRGGNLTLFYKYDYNEENYGWGKIYLKHLNDAMEEFGVKNITHSLILLSLFKQFNLYKRTVYANGESIAFTKYYPLTFESRALYGDRLKWGCIYDIFYNCREAKYGVTGGIFQMWGQDMYEEVGDALDLDLVNNYKLPEKDNVGFRVGVYLYKSLGYADLVPSDEDFLQNGMDDGLLSTAYSAIFKKEYKRRGLESLFDDVSFQINWMSPLRLYYNVIRICAPFEKREIEAMLAALAEQINNSQGHGF